VGFIISSDKTYCFVGKLVMC